MKQALRQCAVFAGLSEAELDKVAALAMEKQYEAGETIFLEGDNAIELLIIREGKAAGQVTLPKPAPGVNQKVTVDVITQNEVTGWSALIKPHVYTLTLVCLQRINALAINGNKLRDLLEGNPRMGYNVFKGLAGVVASRLAETRQMLVNERLLPLKLDRE